MSRISRNEPKYKACFIYAVRNETINSINLEND